MFYLFLIWNFWTFVSDECPKDSRCNLWHWGLAESLAATVAALFHSSCHKNLVQWQMSWLYRKPLWLLVSIERWERRWREEKRRSFQSWGQSEQRAIRHRSSIRVTERRASLDSWWSKMDLALPLGGLLYKTDSLSIGSTNYPRLNLF